MPADLLMTAVLFVAKELVGPIKELIRAAIERDEEAAKAAYVDIMLNAKKVAMRKRRGG